LNAIKLNVTPDLFRGPTLHNGILPLLLVGCRNKSGMTVELNRTVLPSRGKDFKPS